MNTQPTITAIPFQFATNGQLLEGKPRPAPMADVIHIENLHTGLATLWAGNIIYVDPQDLKALATIRAARINQTPA